MPTKPLRHVLAKALADDFHETLNGGALDPEAEELYQDAADVLDDLIDYWNAARTDSDESA